MAQKPAITAAVVVAQKPSITAAGAVAQKPSSRPAAPWHRLRAVRLWSHTAASWPDAKVEQFLPATRRGCRQRQPRGRSDPAITPSALWIVIVAPGSPRPRGSHAPGQIDEHGTARFPPHATPLQKIPKERHDFERHSSPVLDIQLPHQTPINTPTRNDIVASWAACREHSPL